MLHKQLTVAGSWVFGLWQLKELVDFLAWHNLHPDAMVTHRFPWSISRKRWLSLTRAGRAK